MIVTNEIFSAFLSCKTKSYLNFLPEVEIQSKLIDWKQKILADFINRSFFKSNSQLQKEDFLIGTTNEQIIENNNYKYLFDCVIQTKELHSRIPVLEKIVTPNKHKFAHFIPIRFVPNGKLTKNDKLLLAFDAIVLSIVSGKTPSFGKIVYGNQQRIGKIKLAGLISSAKNVISDIIKQLKSHNPPQLILNKHCAECEYQLHCRQEAIRKDDLSLLTNLTEKERKHLQSKGIFTVSQLSYTFRPRRKSKILPPKPERPSPPLKALAIRENKIHIAGKPELKIIGNPVFLDVEGIPNQDFYYLIGLCFKSNYSYIQHSLWADELSNEKEICETFVQILKTIDNPQLIYYGSYEKVFLKKVKENYIQSEMDSIFLNQLIEACA